MNEITYIIGAGASFQSIPLVSTFNNRLLEFAQFILKLRESVSYEGDAKNRFLQASEAIEGLYDEFSSHQSFDTWFKKQFHTGNEVAINQGKRLLHLYFIWEHSRSSFDFNRKVISKEELFNKESLYDKRYDALIAGLLKPYPNVAETMLKINFITWNYDLNLIHSIKNFFAPKKKYVDFIKEITKSQFHWDISNQISVTNINGFFYSSNYDDSSSLDNLNGDEIIKNKIMDGYWLENSKDPDADKIRFAWELNDSDVKSLIDHISGYLQRSIRVVVIGYTFPIYNRIIDSSFMKQKLFVDGSNRKIIVQDPNAEDISSTIVELMGQAKQYSEQIDKKTNCLSFYVPSNIYVPSQKISLPLFINNK